MGVVAKQGKNGWVFRKTKKKKMPKARRDVVSYVDVSEERNPPGTASDFSRPPTAGRSRKRQWGGAWEYAASANVQRQASGGTWDVRKQAQSSGARKRPWQETEEDKSFPSNFSQNDAKRRRSGSTYSGAFGGGKGGVQGKGSPRGNLFDAALKKGEVSNEDEAKRILALMQCDESGMHSAIALNTGSGAALRPSLVNFLARDDLLTALATLVDVLLRCPLEDTRRVVLTAVYLTEGVAAKMLTYIETHTGADRVATSFLRAVAAASLHDEDVRKDVRVAALRPRCEAIVALDSTDGSHVDFRSMAVLPSIEELSEGDTPWLPEPGTGKVTSTEHLSRFFRLLREDMVGPMREELAEHMQAVHYPDSKKKNAMEARKRQLVNVHMRGVYSPGYQDKHPTLAYLPRFSNANGAAECPDAFVVLTFEYHPLSRCSSLTPRDLKEHVSRTRRLLAEDSLVVLIDAEAKEALCVARVVHRREKLLCGVGTPLQRYVGVSFDDVESGRVFLEASLDKSKRFILAMVGGALYSHPPVLERLQAMPQVPMADLLLHSDGERQLNIVEDSYLRNCVAELDEMDGLHSAQKTAMHRALTHRLSLIQGPPGTGKTFVGTRVVKLLKANCPDEKILVVCFTHAALDQFLTKLVSQGCAKWDEMVRFGNSPSDNADLAKINIDNLSRTSAYDSNNVPGVAASRRWLYESRDELCDGLHGAACGHASEGWYAIKQFLCRTGESKIAVELSGRRRSCQDADDVFTSWRAGRSKSGSWRKFDAQSPTEPHPWNLSGAERRDLLRSWISEMKGQAPEMIAQRVTGLRSEDKSRAQLKHEAWKRVVKGRRILGCTSTFIAKCPSVFNSVTTLVLEEAGELLETTSLTCMLPRSLRRVINIGDHKQLRPKADYYPISVEQGSKHRFNVSLFERLAEGGHPLSTLQVQHRMHPTISQFVRPNYEILEDGPNVGERKPVTGLRDRVIFIDHREHESGGSLDEQGAKVNEHEVQMAVRVVRYVQQQGESDVVVLTPYLAQVHAIRSELSKQQVAVGFLTEGDAADADDSDEDSEVEAKAAGVRVSTVDNFQGEEADVIVASMVRSNERRMAGWVGGKERMNVLFSRAKRALVLLGNLDTLTAKSDVWQGLEKRLKKGGHVHNGLPVKCQHNTLTTLRKPEDFEQKTPDGGCRLPCGGRLPCGHPCPLSCHRRQETVHGAHKCAVSVQVTCPEGHVQFVTCAQRRVTNSRHQTACDGKLKALEKEHEKAGAQTARQKAERNYILESQRRWDATLGGRKQPDSLGAVTGEVRESDLALQRQAQAQAQDRVDDAEEQARTKRFEESAAQVRQESGDPAAAWVWNCPTCSKLRALEEEHEKAATRAAKQKAERSNALAAERKKVSLEYQRVQADIDALIDERTQEDSIQAMGEATEEAAQRRDTLNANIEKKRQEERAARERELVLQRRAQEQDRVDEAREEARECDRAKRLEYSAAQARQQSGYLADISACVTRLKAATTCDAIAEVVKAGSDKTLVHVLGECEPLAYAARNTGGAPSLSPGVLRIVLKALRPPVSYLDLSSEVDALKGGGGCLVDAVKDTCAAAFGCFTAAQLLKPWHNGGSGSGSALRCLSELVLFSSAGSAQQREVDAGQQAAPYTWCLAAACAVLWRGTELEDVAVAVCKRAADLLEPRLEPAPSVLDLSHKLARRRKQASPKDIEQSRKDARESEQQELVKRCKAFKELFRMIGLGRVKEEVYRILKQVLVAKDTGRDFKKAQYSARFAGNPGTGKTTVARLYGKALHEIGILDKDQFEETSGTKMITDGADKAKELIDKLAKDGGVLFIDEAYQLAEDPRGSQVLNLLLTEMENNKGRLVVVVAGYPKEMEGLLAKNPGLLSRFPHDFKFEDYSEGELLQILEGVIAKDVSTLDGNATFTVENPQFLKVAARRVARRAGQAGFANAREVQNMYQAMAGRHAARQAIGGPPDRVLKMRDILGVAENGGRTCAAWTTLQAMEGLQRVKKAIEAILKVVDTNMQREEELKPLIDVPLNRVLLGNPGTGKTTVAALFGEILKAAGMLSKGDVVLKTASDLVGRVIGESEKKTSAILEGAMGCVLVIDEAYGLDPAQGGSMGSKCPYREGIINTMVEKISGSGSDDRSVLLLGYEKEMTDMVRSCNPGFNRRFNVEESWHFDDFSDDELVRILRASVEKKQLQLKFEDARRVVKDVLAPLKRKPNFGNAGAVNNAIASAAQRAVGRSSLVFEDFVSEQSAAAAGRTVQEIFAGLSGMEALVARFERLQKICVKTRAAGGSPHEQVPMAFRFVGPPGTGKTTVAKRIGELYCSLGVLGSSKVHEASLNDFVTGLQATREIFRKALGQVLFIDEAYRLAGAREVLDEIVYLMTSDEHKGKMVVVLAGYPKDIDAMLRTNEGLRSRFPEEVAFESFSADVCARILQEECGKRSLLMTPEAEAAAAELMARCVTLETWANARDVENLVQKLSETFCGECDEEGDCLQAYSVRGVFEAFLAEHARAQEAPQVRPPAPALPRARDSEAASVCLRTADTATAAAEPPAAEPLPPSSEELPALEKSRWDGVPDGFITEVTRRGAEMGITTMEQLAARINDPALTAGLDAGTATTWRTLWAQFYDEAKEAEKKAKRLKKTPVWRCRVCGRYGCPVARYIESYKNIEA